MRANSRAIGILHAGFTNTNITYAVPSHLVAKGLSVALKADPPNLESVPTLSKLIADSDRSSKLMFETIGISAVRS